MLEAGDAPSPTPQSTTLRHRNRTRRGWLVLSLVLLCLVSVAWAIGGLGGNVRTVAPGRVYRSAQITGNGIGALTACWTGSGLEQVIKQDGIQTVLNLRGGNNDQAWYRQELETCKRLNVDHIDVSMSAIRAPHPLQLKRVLNVFDHAHYPVLFHCQGGSDRSGLVGTLYVHLYQNVPLDEAEHQQLTMRYAHFKFTRTRAMDDFFDRYRQTAQGMGMRQWITDVYPGLFDKLPEQEKSLPPTAEELLTDIPSTLPAAQTRPGEGQNRAYVPGG